MDLVPVAPSLFVSVGTPMSALAEAEDDPAVAALTSWAQRQPPPRAVVIISAHAVSSGDAVEVDAATRHAARHDYGGFPPALYDIRYDCPGEPDLAARVVRLLSASFRTPLPTLAARTGMDHGAWIPLRRILPAGDIPVVPVALPRDATPRDALLVGQALAPLRQEGVLLVAAGAVVRNPADVVWHGKTAPPRPYAAAFENWVVDMLYARNVEALATYEQQGAHAEQSNPDPRQFLSLLVMLGAAVPGDLLELMHRGIQYTSLSALTCALVPRPTEPSVHG